MKKTLCLLLAMLLCLSLCACQASNAPSEQPTEPSTPPEDFSGVTVSIVSIGIGEHDDLWLYKQIEEKFGCEIEVIEIRNDEYIETMNQLLEDGNLPTIFEMRGGYVYEDSISVQQIIELGEQGKLVDVMAPENLEQMPNFAKLFVEDEDANWEYMLTAAEDGSHYILPVYCHDRAVNQYWIYNETALKEAGVEWRGDPEGFLDMLRQLKAYYPESYPLTGSTWQGTCDRMIYSWGVNSSYAAYDYEKGEWFYGATSDAYYDMLSLFQTAYNEKLMDDHAFVTCSTAPGDNLACGESFLINTWIGWMTLINDEFAYEEVDDHISPAPTPVGPNGMTLEVKKFNINDGIVISNQDPQAAKCAMAIMDWMYDTSEGGGAWLNTVGPDDALQLTENGRYEWNYEPRYPEAIHNDIYHVFDQYGMFQTTLSVRYCPESPYFTYDSPEEYLAQEIGDEVGYFRAPPSVPIYGSEIEEAYIASQEEVKSMQCKFIFQNWTKEDFDAWGEEFNAKYGHIIDYLNEQY